MAKLTITQVRSAASQVKKQQGTIRALGLKRVGHSVTHEDNPIIRGMITKVSHLVTIEESK